MKQNGNHHASAILRTFTRGNLRQRTGNFNSFPAMYGTPRYDVTSRIMGLFPVTFYVEVSILNVLINKDPGHGIGYLEVTILLQHQEKFILLTSCQQNHIVTYNVRL